MISRLLMGAYDYDRRYPLAHSVPNADLGIWTQTMSGHAYNAAQTGELLFGGKTTVRIAPTSTNPDFDSSLATIKSVSSFNNRVNLNLELPFEYRFTGTIIGHLEKLVSASLTTNFPRVSYKILACELADGGGADSVVVPQQFINVGATADVTRAIDVLFTIPSNRRGSLRLEFTADSRYDEFVCYASIENWKFAAKT